MKNHHYRTYIVRRDGKTVFTGSSTECAAWMGVAQATFYRYASIEGAAPAGFEIEISETSGKYAQKNGERPCDNCPRATRCYLTSCEAYRRWFTDKWRGIQDAYRRIYKEARSE